MGHVASVVGGVEEINLYYGDANRRFFPNPADYQEKAVSFLVEHALTTSTIFTGEDIVSRLTPEGTAQRVLSAQEGVLRSLISGQRIKRLGEIEQTSTNAAYTCSRLFTELRNGLFRELGGKTVEIDLYRRNLQRSYVDMLSANLKTPAANSDLPAYSRAELEAIRSLILKTETNRTKPVVQNHLKDLAARITRALDPRPSAYLQPEK
jgi:hypothetical protein